MNLTKGPTITPALLPVPNPLTQTVDIIGFSGLSELDLVSTMILCSFITAGGNSDEVAIDTAIRAAIRLLTKTNEINQRHNKESQEEKSPLDI